MRWKAIIAYDGTDFSGWQSQPGGKTVQDFLEKRLAAIFNQAIRIHGSGRTDAGVHARGQVCHWDAHWSYAPSMLLRALQTGLPQSILVTAVTRVPDAFHARYSAWGKRYIYYLYEGRAMPTQTRYAWSLGNRSLDKVAMRLAAAQLVGVHDFTAFSLARSQQTDSDPVRNLRCLNLIQYDRYIQIIAEANGFLYKMVRLLVGGLIEVGMGQTSPQCLAALLLSRQRNNRIPTAPARGLFLDRVFYYPQ